MSGLCTGALALMPLPVQHARQEAKSSMPLSCREKPVPSHNCQIRGAEESEGPHSDLSAAATSAQVRPQ